ncbi:putative ribonuclease H-like domain-containing protein, partial [Tanacetum coccineum]
MTLIEAARTMLGDSKFKPHNKTPYELFRGFKPALRFMRPFGCHVTILNTLDSLGKFDGKSDKGFFVGYSLSSKAFRVYNTRTRRVEENLHIGFLEYKPMIEGNGTQGELNAGTSKEISQDCIVMPIWKDASYFDIPSKDVDIGELKSAADDQKQTEDGPDNENDEKDKYEDDSSPKEINTTGQHVNTASPEVNTGHFKLNTIEPTSIAKALSDSSWMEAMQEQLVDLPIGKRAIGTKWVFRNKKDKRGIVIRNKARSMIGSLMYLTTSRPDFMFVVCTCARFQVTLKTSHLLAVKRIFRYLKGKPTLGLWYSTDSPFELVAYTDSDYAEATQDKKSTTGG